jgi:ATP-binding cassette subfamily C protein
LTAALLPLQTAFLSIKQSIPAAKRAFQFLDFKENGEESPIVETVESITPQSPVGVKIDNVGFKFAGKDDLVLKDITLDVEPGTQVAFIGPSGAGKSTLADLILGLLQPSSGYISLNGKDPVSLCKSSPGLLGYVPQRPGRVSGTIADNIALGLKQEDIDEVRLEKAIKQAHLTSLIEALPRGVSTNLGKQKDELSGGQLQRIGLARALYSQPRILVMDEATSALDAESEGEINKALDEMRGSVTVILIAHRLNTVQRSDIVYLLQEGRVTDYGSFPKLLQSNEVVKRLANLMSIDSAKANPSLMKIDFDQES